MLRWLLSSSPHSCDHQELCSPPSQAPEVPPLAEIQLQQIPVHCDMEKENHQDSWVYPQGALGAQERKQSHPAKAPGHTKQVERMNQENLNRTVADESGPSNRVGGDDERDTQALGMLPSGHTSTGNQSQGEWICQPNSYLFGAHHPLLDAMSLEFVAMLSQPCNLTKKDKISVIFYKAQGLCEEFANM
ncbi:uncharacterized protein ACIB01_019184 [Guaruba guarouba]